MNILSIQSAVVYGHVGNSAAVFPLQRMGHEVWPIDTVQFSNHTGYGTWRGQILPADHLAALIDGLETLGNLGRCDALLSGYLGDAAMGGALLDAAARMRRSNPAALYCCDPVMGDEGCGLFVRPDIPKFFAAQALPVAQIVTPNQFELECLTERSVGSLDQALSAARALLRRGPRLVCVTSLRPPAVPAGRLGSLVVSESGAWLADTALLQFRTAPNGAGDVFAALFLGHLLKGAEPPAALERTVSGLYALLTRTRDLGHRELALVAAQDILIDPPRHASLTSL